MNKKNITLGIILIALIAIFYLYQGPYKKWQLNQGKTTNFLSKVNADNIDKIKIIDGNSTTTLKKSNSKWSVEGQAVDEQRINYLISQIKKASGENLDLISTNVAKKNLFQTDKSGKEIKLYINNSEVADFIAGKMTNDFQSSYVSTQTTDNTYIIQGVNLYSSFLDKNWVAPKPATTTPETTKKK